MEAPMTLPLGIRDRAMLQLMYGTGVQVSELLSLQLDDINFTAGFLRCLGKGERRESYRSIRPPVIRYKGTWLAPVTCSVRVPRKEHFSECPGKENE